MDQERFDRLTRQFGRSSRRSVLGGAAKAGAALVAAWLGFGTHPADARQCRDYGCTCNGGIYRSCRSGLVCCPYSPGVPGGLGQCLTEDECYGPQCINSGEACAPYCG